MPDPISSSSSSPSYDPYADDAGQVSRADAPNSSQPPPPATSSQAEPPATTSPAVPRLVSSVPPPPSLLPPPAPSAPATANNNAQRTTERSEISAYASYGKTESGDSVYGGFALYKGRDPKSGLEVEVLSGSAQLGAQNELQIGFQRATGARGALSGSVETFTARANLGIYNDDGSKGLNVGAGATVVGFEATVGGATSVTYGVSAGVGLGGSVGLRDVDGDGKKELCGRVSFLAASGGACVEGPL